MPGKTGATAAPLAARQGGIQTLAVREAATPEGATAEGAARRGGVREQTSASQRQPFGSK